MSNIKDSVFQAGQSVRNKAGLLALIPVQFIVGLAIPLLALSIFLITLSPEVATTSYTTLVTRITTNENSLGWFLLVWLIGSIVVMGFLFVSATYQRDPVKSTRKALYVGFLVGLGLTSTFVMARLMSDLVVLAFSLSFIAISATFVIATSILALGIESIGERERFKAIIRNVQSPDFVNILRGNDWYPSLALFQFLLWTVVIGFSYLGVFFIRTSAGVPDPYPAIPPNLLQLMGISIAVPIANTGISRLQHRTEAPREPPVHLPHFSTMLMEGDKPSLTRFQMFAWTWIGVTIYLALVFSRVAGLTPLAPVESLSLPDVDSTLVGLMGLSQGAYIGGKIVAKPKISISDIVPSNEKAQFISILGNGFGTKADTVWLGEIPVRGDYISRWEGRRIDVTMPKGVVADFSAIGVTQGGERASVEMEIASSLPRVGRPGELLSIFGKHFGSVDGDMWLEMNRIPAQDIERWENDRIDFKIPSELATGSYSLRIVKGGKQTEPYFLEVKREAH